MQTTPPPTRAPRSSEPLPNYLQCLSTTIPYHEMKCAFPSCDYSINGKAPIEELLEFYRAHLDEKHGSQQIPQDYFDDLFAQNVPDEVYSFYGLPIEPPRKKRK